MRDSAPLGAIVIAAHNEAMVIGRCLDALEQVVVTGEVQVVVVCNGCVDNTAQIARRRARVEVVELEVASKAAALRDGDRIAAHGPRIYLDADVVLTARAARDVLTALTEGPALAARPPILFDTSGAHWAVRTWYAIRRRLPSIQNALWGAGTYALSVAGRARFGEFPDVVSDDLFVDSLFAESEVAIVRTDPVTVHTPKATGDLLRILIRTYRTQGDVMREERAGAMSVGQRGQLRDIAALVGRHPRFTIAAAIYVALIATARIRTRLGSSSAAWERDNSSRAHSAPVEGEHYERP